MIRQLNEYINNTKNSFPYKGITLHATMPAKPNVADTIYYNNLEKLKWDDFKAKPQKHAVASAATSSAFNYFSQSNIKDGYLTVSVTLQCYFLPRKSWTRFNIKSEEVLDHEQLHFDITHYWALRLVAAINSHQFPATGWQYELEKLKAVFFEDMVAMQLSYDHESDNGRNSGKQFEWRKRVNELLAESPL